jgi:hypothetical protein
MLYACLYNDDCSLKRKRENEEEQNFNSSRRYKPDVCNCYNDNNNNNNNNNSNNNNNNNNNSVFRKNYKYTSAFWNLNPEGKQRWNILKNHHHLNTKELEDWRRCWIIQQNVDENSSVSPTVTCQGYSYTWFVSCIRWTDAHYVPPKKEKKKMVNVPIV